MRQLVDGQPRVMVDGQPRVRQLVDHRFLLVNASAHGSPVIDAAFSDAWEGAFVLRKSRQPVSPEIHSVTPDP